VSVEISAQQFPKLSYVYAHCDALTNHCFKVQCNYSYSIRIRPNSKDPLFSTALVTTAHNLILGKCVSQPDLNTHDEVEHSEVLLESVADEDHPTADEVSQLEIGRLEGSEVLWWQRDVEVARLDAGELGQVVHHLQHIQHHQQQQQMVTRLQRDWRSELAPGATYAIYAKLMIKFRVTTLHPTIQIHSAIVLSFWQLSNIKIHQKLQIWRSNFETFSGAKPPDPNTGDSIDSPPFPRYYPNSPATVKLLALPQITQISVHSQSKP